MKRRTLLAASLAALPATRALAAERTIGWISPESRETTAPFFAALKAGILGHPGGDQVRIVERYVLGGADAMAAAVTELQQQGVALIVAQGGATVGVFRAKPTVPVIFGFSGDPVVAGIVQSLPRPGGNFTGVSFMSVELNAKRVDFLREMLPGCRKVGLLSNVLHAGEEREIEACQRALDPVGITLGVQRVRSAEEIAAAVSRALDEGVQALVVLPSSSMVREAPAISSQCLARGVPVVSGWASIARAGALLTYGPNLEAAYKRVAHHVMRVLAGAKPADLPVEQPTILELVVNRKTANALGLKLPASLLARADEVIE